MAPLKRGSTLKCPVILKAQRDQAMQTLLEGTNRCIDVDCREGKTQSVQIIEHLTQVGQQFFLRVTKDRFSGAFVLQIVNDGQSQVRSTMHARFHSRIPTGQSKRNVTPGSERQQFPKLQIA